jgi:NADPH:quinone reductase-like Zn-dependent oxidoreductase
MQAITYARFGSPDVLELSDVPRPEPAAGEVLVRVHASSVNAWDWHFMRGEPYIARLSAAGVRRPKHPILGGDIAGVVEAVGTGATRFRPGDEVYGFAGFGGFAEYVAVPETLLAPKPANLSFEQAATVPLAAMTVLQGVRDVAKIQPGQKVLIVGASGGLGTFAVQIAKAFGAQVTGVSSTRNLELVRSAGADHVIDYTTTDYLSAGRRYDVVWQLAGTTSASDLRQILTPTGTLILTSADSKGKIVGPMGRLLKGILLGRFVSQTIANIPHQPKAADLEAVSELIEAGKVTPVIERTFALADTAAAIRHLETGRARGKVAIAVASEAATTAEARTRVAA